jgi:hypothetical protein
MQQRTDPEAYDAYRAQQMAKSEVWDSQQVAKLRAFGVDDLEYLIGRDLQFRHGDTNRGLELKHDEGLVIHGNLYIEYNELTRDGREFVPSGIYCAADWQWYGIGDDRQFFVFQRERLHEAHGIIEDGRPLYKRVLNKYKSGHGFLLPQGDAFFHYEAFYFPMWDHTKCQDAARRLSQTLCAPLSLGTTPFTRRE